MLILSTIKNRVEKKRKEKLSVIKFMYREYRFYIKKKIKIEKTGKNKLFQKNNST